jgi:L-fuculose-phosphate aldolase
MSDRRHLDSISRKIAQYSHRMYEKGWVANHDGNISMRVEQNLILLTPTAVSKIDVEAESILGVNLAGEKIFGSKNAFSEINLHLAAYQARPDMMAVVHAHPPYATAYSICRLPLNEVTMPEFVVSLGREIPVTQYALPGPAAAQAVSTKIGSSNALILAGNGVLTVGRDLEEAFLRMEATEHFAQINTLAKNLETKVTLPEADVTLLLEKRSKAGLAPLDAVESVARASKPDPAEDQQLKKIIAEEIAKAMRR